MKVLALAGGVGGAKLCLGLSRVLSSDELQIIVNTGDDEEFYGLQVCPDLDTVMYTLAGVDNRDTGWGVAEETFVTLGALGRLGEDTWFGLGDKDLATHIVRTKLLRDGVSLSDTTDYLRRALGVEHRVAPMTDDCVRTTVLSEDGPLTFQEYFVRLRCEPVATGLLYEGASEARMSDSFSLAIATADVLVICPSNPYLSVAPILSVAGVRSAVETFRGPRVAVSPIVGGEALKGPAAKLLSELGEDVSCVGVARQYLGICDLFVIDTVDRDLAPRIESLGMTPVVCNTVMTTDADKIELARTVLEAAA